MRDMWKDLFRQNRFILYVMLFLSMVIGVVPLAQIHILAMLINRAKESLNGNSGQGVLCHFLLFLLSYAVLWVSEIALNYLTIISENRIREKGKYRLLDRCRYLRLEDLEKSEFYDLHTRVISKCEESYQILIKEINTALTMLIRVCGVIFTIVHYNKWIAAAIIVLTIPLTYFAFKAGQKTYEVTREISWQERRVNYYSRILVDRETAAERKLFGFTRHINHEFADEYEALRKKRQAVEIKNLLKLNVGTVTSTVSGIITLVFLLGSVLRQEITLGLFISLIYAVFDLSGVLSGSMTNMANDFAKLKEYCADINTYNTYKKKDAPAEADEKLPSGFDFESLEFKDVSFQYPGTDKYILKGFSCVIEKGRHYALVGLNGAGKSTFVKLALNLYGQYEGVILLNGIDIKKYPREDINRICSVVFQDFARYSMTVGENIVMATQKKYEDYKSVLGHIDIGRLMEKLPKGIDTYVGKLNDGSVDLSGGEWQKIAMARAIIRGSPLIFLDEPTAAMDPVMESKIYAQFLNMSKDKTSVIISHRLGFAYQYDDILVINNGKIEESGSHEYLMSQKGLYYEMYENQRSWYQ